MKKNKNMGKKGINSFGEDPKYRKQSRGKSQDAIQFAVMAGKVYIHGLINSRGTHARI